MTSGFTEIPHTADWAVRVWAPDLAGIFAEAAASLNSLAGIRLARAPRISKTLDREAPDPETLLVGFLSELVYIVEQERLAFDLFIIETEQRTGSYLIKAMMEGASIIEQARVIKAVTFHDLQIRTLEDGLEVEIVFDV